MIPCVYRLLVEYEIVFGVVSACAVVEGATVNRACDGEVAEANGNQACDEGVVAAAATLNPVGEVVEIPFDGVDLET